MSTKRDCSPLFRGCGREMSYQDPGCHSVLAAPKYCKVANGREWAHRHQTFRCLWLPNTTAHVCFVFDLSLHPKEFFVFDCHVHTVSLVCWSCKPVSSIPMMTQTHLRAIGRFGVWLEEQPKRLAIVS